jgi:hypothetical protein
MPTVRQIEEAAVAAVIVALPNLSEAQVAWEALELESRGRLQEGFAVGTPTSTMSGETACLPWESTVVIRVLRRLRGDRHLGDYRDTLDVEPTLLQGALDGLRALDPNCLASPLGIGRSILDAAEGWLLTEFSVLVEHDGLPVG